MRSNSGGVPPRYFTFLRLGLVMMLLWGIPWVPFCLTYFLPLGAWSKLLIVLSPLLWFTFVNPARVRCGEIMIAYARDENTPMRARDLLFSNQSWWSIMYGRAQLMYRWTAPAFVLLAAFVPMLWLMDPFAALKIVLDVFGGIATAAATAVAALPRLLMGKPPVVQAGALGAGIALGVVLAVSLGLLLWGVFLTAGYRFGYTRIPKTADIKPLLKQNLLLWLPTIALFVAFAAASYGEMILMAANVLSAEAVFTVKLQPMQAILLALVWISYVLLLPLRKRNTALWVAEHS